MKSSLPYLLPFGVYVFIGPILALFLTASIAMTVKVALMLLLIILFRSHYKFKPNFHPYALVAGLAIFLLWVGLEPFYTPLGSQIFVPENIFFLILRIVAAIIVAPLIEEFFTRFFLNRVLVQKDLETWDKLPIYKFTVTSFIVTVLFFGLSHDRWLPGIISGIILNLVLLKTKKIDACITAHIVANVLLIIYIVTTHSWFYW